MIISAGARAPPPRQPHDTRRSPPAHARTGVFLGVAFFLATTALGVAAYGGEGRRERGGVGFLVSRGSYSRAKKKSHHPPVFIRCLPSSPRAWPSPAFSNGGGLRGGEGVAGVSAGRENGAGPEGREAVGPRRCRQRASPLQPSAPPSPSPASLALAAAGFFLMIFLTALFCRDGEGKWRRRR